MARPVGETASDGLKKRIYSSLVLGPIALAAAYLAHPYFDVLIAILAVAMAWEWARMCNRGAFGSEGYISVLCLVGAMGATNAGRYDLALYVVLVGAASVYAAARFLHRPSPVLSGAAPIAIGLACVSLVWLRDLPNGGLAAVIWLLGAVWTTDIAAYFIGRRIGGPRLAPRISPKKTWSGLVGAMICAALWGSIWGLMPGASDAWLLAVLGAAVAVIAQAGDLSISSLKRHFGAKDASDLIPGHGGVLDRFDGFVVSAPVVAIFAWFSKGIVWPSL